jgi:hypothetical protein
MNRGWEVLTALGAAAFLALGAAFLGAALGFASVFAFGAAGFFAVVVFLVVVALAAAGFFVVVAFLAAGFFAVAGFSFLTGVGFGSFLASLVPPELPVGEFRKVLRVKRSVVHTLWLSEDTLLNTCADSLVEVSVEDRVGDIQLVVGLDIFLESGTAERSQPVVN